MFRSKPNASAAASLCRKHPKHRQSPGVCSLCLTQRLAKISSGGFTRDAPCRRVYSEEGSSSQLSSSSSSSDVSSDVSSCVSPGRETNKKTDQKTRFWSRLLISRRKNAYFQGRQVLLSHSEPLPTITSATTSTRVLAN